MDGRVGIPLSHGCVRLQIDNAKWIYDNIPRGTKSSYLLILTYKKKSLFIFFMKGSFYNRGVIICL